MYIASGKGQTAFCVMQQMPVDVYGLSTYKLIVCEVDTELWRGMYLE